MTRFKTIGRIIGQLQQLDDASLTTLLAELSEDFSEAEVITYGKDDTEHLLSSAANTKDLNEAAEDLKDIKFLSPHHAS